MSSTGQDRQLKRQSCQVSKRERFVHGAISLSPEKDSGPSQPQYEPMDSPSAPVPTRPVLRTLDLRGLQRDDGPPSESHQRKEKLNFYEKQCSEVWDRLFVSGDLVAKSKDTLAAHGVTHVMNCVGFVCKEYFKDELTYKTYYLEDSPVEEIQSVFYDAFDFIEEARNSGGRVLVHCSQGVSRSATIAIAYLIWRTGRSYEEVFKEVKEKRGITNPNIGFAVQLAQWQKRRREQPSTTRLYRIQPYCRQTPGVLVPRLVKLPQEYTTHTWRQLDPRGAFVVQTRGHLYVWIGSQCPEAFATAAQRFTQHVIKYESVGSPVVITCQQGSEPEEFVRLMDPPQLDPAAEQQNARRASVTGELYGSLGASRSSFSASAPNSTLSFSGGQEAAAMDTDTCPPVQGPITSTSGAHSITESSWSDLGEAAQPSTTAPVAGLPRLQLPHSDSGAGPTAGLQGAGSNITAHPLLSPMLVSPYPATPGDPDTLMSQDSQGLLRCGLSQIQPVDEYNKEYMWYQEWIRQNCYVIEPGSDAAQNLSHYQPRPADRLRLSVNGAENGLDFRSVGSASLSPSGPSDNSLALALNTPGSMGSGGVGLHHVGSTGLLGRPESPAAAEGRLKKYRRGAAELSSGSVLAKPASLRMFPSLHQSMDDEDMPS